MDAPTSLIVISGTHLHYKQPVGAVVENGTLQLETFSPLGLGKWEVASKVRNPISFTSTSTFSKCYI